MVVVMSILIGLNWQRINGRRFIKLRELHVVVGCVEGRSTTAKDISKRLCVLSKNQNIRCLMKRKKRCWKVKQFLMVCKCLIEPYTVIGSKILQTMSRSRKITMLQNRVNILVNTLCRSTVCFERMSYVHTLGIGSFGKFKNTFQRTFYRQVGVH